MKRSLAVVAFVAMVASVAALAAGEGTVYGKGVTLAQAVKVGELLATPEAYVGKTVRVDGVVTAVCAKRGCWMMLTDGDAGQGIRIKVEDGVIVFPMDAMGRKASAEGIFEVVNPVGEHAGEHAGEHGEAGGGKPADGTAPHSCSEAEKAAKKASATYQIAGLGAVVY